MDLKEILDKSLFAYIDAEYTTWEEIETHKKNLQVIAYSVKNLIERLEGRALVCQSKNGCRGGSIEGHGGSCIYFDPDEMTTLALAQYKQDISKLV